VSQPNDQDHLARIAKDIQKLCSMMTTVINYITEAEAEVPEKIRRFMNYFHDLHDIKFMYEEHGQPPPKHVLQEIERLDDRYRHLLDDMKEPGGTLDKIRRDMAQRSGNRRDYTKQLTQSERYE
jgi:hypothetical protein